MDTQKLVQQVKARFKHAEAKLYLEEKWSTQLHFPNQGGMWTATPELIAYLRTTTAENTVLLDDYKNPVLVNVAELRTNMEDIYNNVMQGWWSEWMENSNLR